MIRMLKRFYREDEGATVVEYALLVAIISVAAVVIIAAIGAQVNASFTEVRDLIAAGAGKP